MAHENVSLQYFYDLNTVGLFISNHGLIKFYFLYLVISLEAGHARQWDSFN